MNRAPKLESFSRDRDVPPRESWVVAMKIDGHKLVRSDDPAKRAFRRNSASFFQSLTTAFVVGVAAALIGVAMGATLYYDHVAWYISAAAGPVVDTLVVTCLATIALERARKRSI